MNTEATDHVEHSWPALAVTLSEIDRVVPYAKNSRKHTASQIEQIANAIKQWGFTFPLLVDEQGGLIAGHARLEAAKLLKLTKVPVATATGWSEEQKRAYVIADNRLAESSSWDSVNLIDELAALTGTNFDMGLMGFTSGELAKLMGAVSAAELLPQEGTDGQSRLDQKAAVTCPQCGHVFTPA
jgi:ParB-like chromosome segregation protein Spo0J